MIRINNFRYNLLILLVMLSNIYVTAQGVVISLKDGSKVYYSANEINNIELFGDKSQTTIDGQNFVDLGLPSGTLWASMNIGASKPEDYGNYFAWGETSGYNEGKESFEWKTYIWMKYSETKITKYNNEDGRIELEASDDVATKKWGNNWQTPSTEQINELIEECDWSWETRNRIKGCLVKSKVNDNSIFLPAGSSYPNYSTFIGKIGDYWSRTLRKDYNYESYYLCFDNEGGIVFSGARSNGMSIRPVVKKFIVVNKSDGSKVYYDYSTVKSVASYIEIPNEEPEEELDLNGHHYVDLGLPSGTLWATTNVGANKDTDNGDYFAWGETSGFKSGKKSFNWGTYLWCRGSGTSMTKYCTKSTYGTVDNKYELDPSDDPATVNWGKAWQTPSSDQLEELINYCEWKWTLKSGVNGYVVTSKKNGNSLFLPASKIMVNSSLVGSDNGAYRSRDLYSTICNQDYHLSFGSSSIKINAEYRYYGITVRPVIKK